MQSGYEIDPFWKDILKIQGTWTPELTFAANIQKLNVHKDTKMKFFTARKEIIFSVVPNLFLYYA